MTSNYRNGLLGVIAGGSALEYTSLIDQTGLSAVSFFFGTTTHSLGAQFPITETCNLGKVGVELSAGGSPTGDITVYLYDQASPTTNDGATALPDDRMATATAVIDASTLTGSAVVYEVFFAATAVTSGHRWHVVVHHATSDGTNNVRFHQSNTFIGSDYGMGTRGTGVPGATADDVNWTEFDPNNAFGINVYKVT